MKPFQVYKKHWEEAFFRKEIEKEQHRQAALREAETLKQILIDEFRVKRIILFGSVLCRGAFEADSDIDIAVEGLAKEEYFPALARLMMASPWEVDLKPIEEMEKLLRDHIAEGQILYEKRESS